MEFANLTDIGSQRGEISRKRESIEDTINTYEEKITDLQEEKNLIADFNLKIESGMQLAITKTKGKNLKSLYKSYLDAFKRKKTRRFLW